MWSSSPLATSLNSIKTPKFITSCVITFRNPPLMITGTAMYGLSFNKIGTWWSNAQERCAQSLLSSRCLLCMCASPHMIYHNTLQRMTWLTLPSIMCADTEDVRKCSPNVFSLRLYLIPDVTSSVTSWLSSYDITTLLNRFVCDSVSDVLRILMNKHPTPYLTCCLSSIRQ